VRNGRLARFPGNVFLNKDATGLPWDSVANVSQIFAADRAWLRSLEGKIDQQLFREVLAGIDLILGR
jgi:mRNA interferase MazF